MNPNENNLAVQEINLSDDRFIQLTQIIDQDYQLGVMLKNKKRLFVVMLNGKSSNTVYGVIDPTDMLQITSDTFEDIPSLINHFENNMIDKAEKWYAFHTASQLLHWSMGSDNQEGQIIIFGETMIEPDSLEEESIIGIIKQGVIYYLNSSGSGFSIVNSQNNHSEGTFTGSLPNVLNNIKGEYGNVQAFRFGNTPILFDWIVKNSRNLYV